MKKRLLAAVMAAAMTVTMAAGCGSPSTAGRQVLRVIQAHKTAPRRQAPQTRRKVLMSSVFRSLRNTVHSITAVRASFRDLLRQGLWKDRT